jgi:cell division protein FtsW (lipid II flippase)
VALAGFAFSALLAMVILEATIRPELYLTIYYLLVSFLCFLSALNLQGYKASRWQDQFGTALVDTATLSLILSVASVLYVKGVERRFAILTFVAAILVWVIDHGLRVHFQWMYLKAKSEVRSDDKHKDE